MSRMATYWNPWREMNRLRREMDHLVNYEWAPLARGTSAFPPVNLWENETGLVLTAELPGLDAAQLDVSLEKGALTISGGRAGEPAKAEGRIMSAANAGSSPSNGPSNSRSTSTRKNAMPRTRKAC